MNKPLNAGILLILSIVLLYLGGVLHGFVGAGLAVGGFVCFVMAIIGAVKSIASRGKTTNRRPASNIESSVTHSKDKYAHLEKKRSWRISKVSFWIAILLAVLYFLLYQDEYGRSDLQGVALFIVLICFPLYLLYKKVVYYIVSGE